MILKKFALFLAVLTLFVLTGCKDPAEKATVSPLPPVEVQLETLAPSEVPVQVELAGSVQAVEHATISARVAGQIVKLPVQLGSKVNKGDLLVKISAAEINARVRQAEIQLAQAQRKTEQLRKRAATLDSKPVNVRQ